MRFLPSEEQGIVDMAKAIGLDGASPPPAYLSPHWCTVLSVLLALPTFGYSLILVPILWVIQHDRTATRLTLLRLELERVSSMEMACRENVPAA
ncbi:MAG: hypothetical protein VKL58_00020 [Cyanobacteriota bacterium]|jgi:hypothetical protein|nr:hypothetical protein [Cyanobacteriota bacterium]